MSIGKNIKKYRKLKGMTQKELGAIIDKKEITIRKYESEDICPSIEILKKISIALNKDYTDLLGNTTEEIAENYVQTSDGKNSLKKADEYLTKRKNLLNEFIINEYNHSELSKEVKIDELRLNFLLELAEMQLERYITSMVQIKLEENFIKYKK